MSERCPLCAGLGIITCGCCWGGQQKPVCPDCGGTGKIAGQECARCSGQGRMTPQSCKTCGNRLPCPQCDGSGFAAKRR